MQIQGSLEAFEILCLPGPRVDPKLPAESVSAEGLKGEARILQVISKETLGSLAAGL